MGKLKNLLDFAIWDNSVLWQKSGKFQMKLLTWFNINDVEF
jgi:hypothetical protein